MADITMCRGKGCPLASTCYRHLAKVDPFMQSWFTQEPHKDGECSEYWKHVERRKEKDKMASMSMCDVCGQVVKHTDAKFVKLYNEKPTGAVGSIIATAEVCPECYEKLAEVLKIPTHKGDEE